MKIFLLLFCFNANAVEYSDLEKHKCTAEDLKVVDAQYTICNKSTLNSSFCYMTAVAGICKLKEQKK